MTATTPTAPDYRGAVEDAVRRVCGVGYGDLLEVAPSLDRGGQRLARARSDGLAPAAFAELFRRSNNLTGTDAADSPEAAASGNLRQAAIAAFTSTSRWKLEPDGRATMETQAGTLALQVVEKDGRHGFGVSVNGGEHHVRIDLGDAVRDVMLQLRAGMAPAAPKPAIDGDSPGMRMGG